jgi:hypothetical protein
MSCPKDASTKIKGFTLVEGLAAGAIIVVVGILLLVATLFSRAGGRDIKRLSDMDVLRAKMFSVKVKYGSFVEAGCLPGPVAYCRGSRLEEIMPTLPNFIDPSGKTLCSTNCRAACEYSFKNSPTVDQYEVLFYLEKGAGKYTKGCYLLTEKGIELQK